MHPCPRLIPIVLVVVLAACGSDAPAPPAHEPPAAAKVVVRHLYAGALLRGASVALLPEGRARLDLMHLGGGTLWLGTWVEQGELLTLTLPRQRPQLIDWSAPTDVSPPDEIVLRRTGPSTWVEVSRTIAAFDKAPKTWVGHESPVPRKALGGLYGFVSQAEHEEEWGSPMTTEADTLDVER